MHVGDPRPRRSRATKVHAENLLEQARRSAWQRAQPGPLLGHGCIVCRYPPPSLKLHLHCLTPENGNKADRRSGQPLEHKISRSHATAEYTPNGARVQSELPCLAARSRPAPRPLSREPKQSLPNRSRGPRYIERNLPGCKVYSPYNNASCLSTQQAHFFRRAPTWLHIRGDLRGLYELRELRGGVRPPGGRPPARPASRGRGRHTA